MPWPKSNVAKYPAILAERYLAFGPTVEVIKNRLRHPLARDGPKVLDANHPR